MAAKAEQFGVVKEVVSGDTVVIRGKPVKGPPPEKTVQLAGIVAPKLARRPTPNRPEEQKDEPFAWHAREALRRLLVGKPVKYTVEYTVPTTGRDFVRIVTQDGKDAAAELVAQGWLKARQQGANQSTPESEALSRLEQAAQAAGVGMWSRDPAVQSTAVRSPQWNVEADRSLVVPNHSYDAIIEQVRDGSTVRLFLLPSFKYVTVQLSGIKTPGFKRAEDGSGAEVPEPFADEAKFFVESRLLQRDVKVFLEGVTNQGFLGTVLHPAGNIAELLLQEGMARIVDWSLSCVSQGKDKYRAAEQAAKQRKLRIWREYVAPAGFAGEKEYTAKVVEIVNAENIVVKHSDGSFRRLTLASIRGPKAPEGVKPKNHFDTPWLYEAKEFLRGRLIGKKVHVAVDFVKPAQDGFPERTCATVIESNINVAEALVSKGYATVVRYRADDDQRSSRFDELLAAEQRAMEGKKGMHKENSAPVHRIQDTSSNKEVARQFLPFLQRNPRQRAVADYVVHGSRMRLYLPKESAIISFVLSGISCPRTGRQEGDKRTPDEPFAQEATVFTKELCLQHEVEIQIDGMDKVGNFIGTMYVDGTNVSVALVEAGLSSVHFTADRLPYYSQLTAAEERAKAAKLNIWKNFVEEKKEDTVEEVKEREVKYKEVIVTEIIDGRTVYVQNTDKAVEVEQLMARLNAHFEANPPIAGAYAPKAGDLVAAKFYEDKNWYRAKATKVAGGNVDVFFIDYGNSDTVTGLDIAALPTEFGLAVMPAVAQEVHLACVQLPNDEEWQDEAAYFLRGGILNKQYQMNPEYTDNGKQFVTLVDPSNKVDVGKTVITAGLAVVERRREFRLRALIADYTAAMDVARNDHRNIWEYGDFVAEEAREFGFEKKKEEEKKAAPKKK
eukprot:comp9044_c0_seq1/m.4227 comp9044_c0_seq1/g.4227  ORF comp9044_c0_seq1/g.4227 comp9044_c0_seq1/m.4227 type:complete len:894 (-) comp9044_c0_seq1:191-2872(-)